MDQYGTWHGGRPQPRRLCIRWGPSPPIPQIGAEPPAQFAAHFYSGQTAGCIKMPLGIDFGLSPGGIQSSLPKKGAESPKFSAHIHCDRTAGWIKMALGTEIGLSPGDCVGWDPATPRKKGTPNPTQFFAHIYCGQTAGCMKTPLGTEVDPGQGHIVLDGVPAPAKGAQQPPLFGPCLWWQRSPISATAEPLYKNSAVAEMGERGLNRHGPKRGVLQCSSRGGAGTPSNTMWP